MNSPYDDDVDHLFGGPFHDFIQRRTLLARALRRAGRPSEASRVEKLSKPTFPAWLVNHLYQNRSDSFQKLLEAGDKLRQAQQAVLPGQGLSSLHDAQRQVQQAITSLLELAREEALGMKRPLTVDTQRRLVRTLEAIAQAARESFHPPLGRFVQDLKPLGFDTVLELAASLPRRDTTTGKKAVRSSTGHKAVQPKRLSRSSGDLAAQARARQEKAVLQARAHRDQARRESLEARRSLLGLVQKQRRCREEMEALEDQLSVLKKEIRHIEGRLDRARREDARKTRRLEQAEQNLAKIAPGGGP